MKRIFVVMLTATLVATVSGIAEAGTAIGYGNTDYAYANRRECCEAAAFIAQDAGASQCRARGGYPTLSRNVRGYCDTRTGRDGRGRPIYSCSSKVTVKCR